MKDNKSDDYEAFGQKMENMGKKIEEAISKLDLEDLGKRIEECFLPRDIDKEQIKKIVKGLILTQKTLPINKLAITLNISNNEAENVIYELVADGIEGVLETEVFKFSNNPDEVISKLNDLIDKL
ncbi:hypothetical protein LCGC14_0587530 [marine sediment metagenome]|uniref:PCI domain-containing protein n=1 Tax=marine sediment metagenome TaxID=412755 RepID=A0A0F9U0R1_9ZZZZ|nr:MAG: hypothetical protein Lokiarch_18420 [Candidatus Lokiarchaeum sp. GC14_75]